MLGAVGGWQGTLVTEHPPVVLTSAVSSNTTACIAHDSGACACALLWKERKKLFLGSNSLAGFPRSMWSCVGAGGVNAGSESRGLLLAKLHSAEGVKLVAVQDKRKAFVPTR